MVTTNEDAPRCVCGGFLVWVTADVTRCDKCGTCVDHTHPAAKRMVLNPAPSHPEIAELLKKTAQRALAELPDKRLLVAQRTDKQTDDWMDDDWVYW